MGSGNMSKMRGEKPYNKYSCILVLIACSALFLLPFGLMQCLNVKVDRLKITGDTALIVPNAKTYGDRVSLPNGKAAIDSGDTLIYEADGVQTPICENVSSVGWDGEKVLYYCMADQTLYSWLNGESQHIFTLDLTEVVNMIYGAKSGIIFSTGGDFYCYTYEDQKITQAQCLININQEAFVYEDWIISMWGDYTNFTAYNLASNETVILDISKTLPGGDCQFTEFTYATHDGLLFMSLRVLEVNGWVEGVDVEGVYEIDLETMAVRVLHDKYFEELYCTELGLYAKGKFRTIELCRFD